MTMMTKDDKKCKNTKDIKNDKAISNNINQDKFVSSVYRSNDR